jgi:hypothetical protein
MTASKIEARDIDDRTSAVLRGDGKLEINLLYSSLFPTSSFLVVPIGM